MDHTDADNVKPTDECHEVHNVDESDILVGKLFSSRDQAWYFYKGFAQEHGFSARRGTTQLEMEGNVKTQAFCCSKEGAVSKADIDEATTLKEVGVGTSQVMNYLTQQEGGYHNVGFTHKDLYNALQRGKAKEIVDGDVNALIAYFDYKKHDDPGFFVTYSVDKSRALHNLIWSDSTSRSDYICFGDVIAFDTTYKDNLYGRSIMPIFGVNHHHNTIVFAAAIIANETSQSFEWVLHNFLEAMMNKSPISVVTDGDRAMQRAIKSVIPNTKHKLSAFSKCMASWWTTEEFDIQWRSVVQNSTSKSIHGCESMNVSLAIALKHKKTYLDVVRAIEDGISRMRLNELKANYLSSQTKPFQITKLTVGLPCRHQLNVLKHLDYTYLPGSLIQSRWTKDANASAPSFVDLNVPQEIMQMARFDSLHATTSTLCYAASKTGASFKTAKDEMKRLTEEFENSFGLNDSINRSSVLNNVRDPQRKQRKRKEVTKNKVEKKIR
ncbi:hypothetical protein F3Y22_tig00014862pilonHSYRG00036 [Hibiscus syriacus]|uniref:MULE transposase domain-containing protein n=1 Tax=Hibiscus syriacus TaxID=106335 RepID=A0A6A3BYF5_HIBSY|nr:hypothetical protein F3Y22_tig00014862pilonHSYRG00036 [Hibiscus syriacus]